MKDFTNVAGSVTSFAGNVNFLHPVEQVALIFVTYLAVLDIWKKFHLLKIGFFHGRALPFWPPKVMYGILSSIDQNILMTLPAPPPPSPST